MAVKIRLRRTGRKKQAHYRIVVSESRNPRGGKVVETLGSYSPYLKDKPLVIDLARVEEWRSKGATPTEAVLKLLRRARQRDAKPAEAASAPREQPAPKPRESVPAPMPEAIEPPGQEPLTEERPED